MKQLLLTIGLWMSALMIQAQTMAKQKATIDSLEASLHYQRGEVKLHNGVGTLRIPAGFRYLDEKQSQFVVEELWGNPKNGSVLGLIVPDAKGVLDSTSWAFVVQYEEIGYVKDDDADDINYDELMADMKKESAADNEERKQQGYEPVQMVGWATKPFYDKNRKILHWAKEIKFGESQDNTLNYNVRILGRKGVLVLNAVSNMKQLPEVTQHISKVLDIATFDKGYQYGDFDPEVDEVAAWTIGSLVAGKVLAKVGFFAMLLKFWKVIVFGIGGAVSFVWKRLRGRREEEVAAVVETSSDENPTTA